jgi:putative oxidoreductase
MNRFLSPFPVWQNQGIALIRVIVGFFMIYHGCEVFDSKIMAGYLGWDQFKNMSAGKFLVYLGKSMELLGGVFLFIGLFTRLACLVLIITMLYITFVVSHGKIWYEDQHPFLFVLLGFVFLFTGPGSMSLDRVLFQKRN